MRLPRRARGLTGEESRLWAEIAKLITPLRGRAKPAPAPSAAAKPAPAAAPASGPGAVQPAPAKTPLKMPPKPPAKRSPAKPAASAGAGKAAPAVTAAPYQAPPAAPRPPAGLDRPARLGLRRGQVPIEARIDLHGLYQAEAHAALVGFILRSRAAGHAHVLVVTGKGGANFHDAFGERGVIRRSVPHWLRGPELRSLVIGFEEAARHHGGAGALYVRLRRR